MWCVFDCHTIWNIVSFCFEFFLTILLQTGSDNGCFMWEKTSKFFSEAKHRSSKPSPFVMVSVDRMECDYNKRFWRKHSWNPRQQCRPYPMIMDDIGFFIDSVECREESVHN